MTSNVNKKRALRRKRIRRRRMIIGLFCLSLVAIITLGIMCFTKFFPVKKYNITGISVCTKSEIRNASGLNSGEIQLLSFSTDKMEKAIYDGVAYVESVTVKKVFPDAVKIDVTEAVETAYFTADDGYYILSAGGKILKIEQQEPHGLYEIVTSGISGNICQKAKYKSDDEKALVNSVLSQLNSKKIKINKIDVSNSLEITVRVEDKFEVLLGTKENLDRKIAQLSSMIDEIGERSGKINLSVWTPQNTQGIFTEN